MRYCVPNNERVLAGNGYSGPKIVYGLVVNYIQNSHSKRLRTHPEQVKEQLKSFSCLRHKCGHPVDKHDLCFFAVADIVQIDPRTPSVH